MELLRKQLDIDIFTVGQEFFDHVVSKDARLQHTVNQLFSEMKSKSIDERITKADVIRAHGLGISLE